MTLRLSAVLAVAVALAVATVSGCSTKNENAIKITGSDTMVNLAQAWAEGFRGDHPDISLQIKGGGSGVGIAALCSGQDPDRHGQPADEAQGDRAGREEHRQAAAGVHRRPRRAGDLRESRQPDRHDLAGATGRDLRRRGPDHEVAGPGHRQSPAAPTARSFASAGRTARARTPIFASTCWAKKREYKQGAMSQSGSSDIVALISKTPCAIGYSGMGYNERRREDVESLGQEGGAGGRALAGHGARRQLSDLAAAVPLHARRTHGRGAGIHSAGSNRTEGQKIVESNGYVPVHEKPPAG